jgi:hypothetical protein
VWAEIGEGIGMNNGENVYLDINKEHRVTYNGKNIEIDTGCDTLITIDKVYGPLCANAIRVHLDYDSVSWIIEREQIVYTVKSVIKDENGITHIDNDITTKWDEVARIDANIESDGLEDMMNL